MRYLFVLFGFCLTPFVLAAPTSLTDQSQPYEIVPIESDIFYESHILGELEGQPIMYEVKVEEDSRLVAQVWQPANRTAAKFALIAIRQNDRGGGVTEVARMNALPDSWVKQSDSQIGLAFLQSASINESVEAGTYRIEISTPENAGKFLLRIGDSEADQGYLESLSSARTTQQFFDHGLFSMLRSSLVYQPLLFFLLMFVVYKSCQYRKAVKTKAHVSN